MTEIGSGNRSRSRSQNRIPSDSRSRPGAIAILLLTSAAATWGLYGRVLRLWWTNDDFYALHVLHGRSLAEAFLSPGVWRQSRMFTPLLMLSFDADLLAFGLRPEAFYAHQLVALAAAAAALVAVLRLWLPWTLALLAALLFLAGVPTIAWAQELLVRHYAEGLILAAFATRLFVLSLRRGRPTLAWGSYDEAASTDRCGQERLLCGGSTFGEYCNAPESFLRGVWPRPPHAPDPGEEITRGRTADHQGEGRCRS